MNRHAKRMKGVNEESWNDSTSEEDDIQSQPLRELRQEKEKVEHLKNLHEALSKESRQQMEDFEALSCRELNQEKNKVAHLEKAHEALSNQLKQQMKDFTELSRKELKQARDEVEHFKRAHEAVTKKYKQQMEVSNVLKIGKQERLLLDEVSVEKWRKLSRTHFDSIKKVLKLRDDNVEKEPYKFNEAKIHIEVPHHFILQDFFERYQDESSPKRSTFLFRDLTNERKKHAPKNYYSYKLFIDWFVKFDAPIKNDRGHTIKALKGDNMVGTDCSGGATSQFISQFCMQLGSLFVMLPIASDIKNRSFNILREELEPKDFLTPIKGTKVSYRGASATVIDYSDKEPGKEPITRLRLDNDRGTITVKERKKFTVKQIPIELFDQATNGLVLRRDEYFKNSMDMYEKYTPQIELEELENTARKYYRAIGRFLLHVIADGRNPIPSTVLPVFFRNVLLRNCMPGTAEYIDSEVLINLAQIGGEFEQVDKFFGENFDIFGIEKEGIITRDNFFSDFVPMYVIDSRKKNLDALREGLTLDGEFPINSILSCQPLEAVNQQFFSKPTISLHDVVSLLRPIYEVQFPDERSLTMHTLFVEKTMPEALKRLTEKKPTFLADFVFFVTGSRCIPYFLGNPDFDLKILFESGADGRLPSSYTCENLLQITWNVYDNDVEVLMQKLEQAVEYGLKAGFDRE